MLLFNLVNDSAFLMQVLLSRLTFFGTKDTSGNNGLLKYRQTAEAIMCGLLPKSPTATSSRTDGNFSLNPIFDLPLELASPSHSPYTCQ